MLQANRITLIFGKICSGKSTFSDALCYVTKAKRITVSDVVKRLSGRAKRSELQDTAGLDIAIAGELVAEIDKYDRVVIDGIRQLFIARYIIDNFQAENVDMIWLEVPDEIRRYRFNDRMQVKDDSTFEQADKKDDKLGLSELQKALEKSYVTINN